MASGFSFVPGSALGQLDQLINTVTRDYIRTTNGEWSEVSDARSTAYLMLELELGASPFDPGDGTSIKAAMRTGDPVTLEDVQAETIRALSILQSAGVLTDLVVAVRDQQGRALRDESGRPIIRSSWRDLTSGSPVDLIHQPG